MVLLVKDSDMDDAMPQTVPSAGFTPPCDYSNFADSFDLSLLPGGDQLVSPSTQLYPANAPSPKHIQPKIFTTFYANSSAPQNGIEDNIDLGPDFQKLLGNQDDKLPPTESLYLEVTHTNKTYQANSPSANSLSPYSHGLKDHFGPYRQSADANFYPSSPEISLYTPSPSSVYSQSPREDFNRQYIKQEAQIPSTSPLPSYSPYRIKEENFLSPCGFSSPTSPATSYSSLSSPEQLQFGHSDADVLDLLENTVLDKQIKQESTVDFTSILEDFHQETKNLQNLFETSNYKTDANNTETKPKDHQLLRQVLRDTSFQKKYNIKTFDFGFFNTEIKMEEPDTSDQSDLIRSCNEQLAGEDIEPVLSLAIEQMRKDVNSTCAALRISPDPTKWTPPNVLSWIQWTSRQFGLPEPISDQWDISGSVLSTLSEEDFTHRAPQGGMTLHAQLEIWKAACSEEDLSMSWLPETTSSNASSGDVSDDEDEEIAPPAEQSKPSTSRSGGTHIHLWQFLKELLASPQTHGSCIRWLDRSKGIFKIEDSVKVARLWGKRKNRPAMNYDKLSRSIRQYYKKGIMKKTERSQRLVYQFCHPYNL